MSLYGFQELFEGGNQMRKVDWDGVGGDVWMRLML